MLAAPVVDAVRPDRSVIGVVVAGLPWGMVQQILQSDAGYNVWLFNRQGVQIGQTNPASAAEKMLVSTVSQKGYKDFAARGWVLKIATPAAAVFTGANQLAVILPVLSGVVILGLLPFLLRFYNQNFIQPIRSLIQTAKGVTTGGLLTSRVAVKAGNEIGQLGSAFNEMVDKLQDVYRSLEKATSERTTELAQKVDEIDRMKTEFISLASHQLRTPLSAIKWFSEMLLAGDAGKLKPEQHEFTQNIAESTERMIELVDSLLNISRIESGRIIVEPEPTDLQELMDGIVSELSARVEAKHQKLVVKTEKSLSKVNLDSHLISQVYINLLTNAIKYTADGGEISVLIKREGDQVVSQVKDNGYGIPKAAQEHLFQKFYRADNAVKIETDGTGLGLYLVKAIVKSSGGKIWFESKEGHGTSFWFTVPLAGMARKEGDVMLDDEIIF